MKVGFIGLGKMGGAVARNIQRDGFDLIAHDIEKAAAEKLIEYGASWADTPAETINHNAVIR
jgi:3-hydroxyisobutyrate dehydrogenase-like beta-hydroxyacid dehydrogenase